MTGTTIGSAPRRKGIGARAIGALALVALFVAMGLDTEVVRIGSEADVRPGTFSAQTYGAETFPTVRSAIEERAADAATLAAAIAEDKRAAGEKYGVPGSIGPVMSVRFEGVVGEGKSGVHDVAVNGVPAKLRIRVQTGPAINGTDLRDATGTIEFGQFRNQIEYQDAGSAINEEMKAEVLAPLDTSGLSGKRVSVVGAFKLINPKSWLVTPVALTVE